jgi:hypothetical protein
MFSFEDRRTFRGVVKTNRTGGRAAQSGITVPPMLFARADEVIE